MIKKAIISLTLVVTLISVSFADSESETHDGFMFRFQASVGFLSSTEKDTPRVDSGTTDQVIEGLASASSFQFGGAIVEDFIIFFTMNSYLAFSPSAERDDDHLISEHVDTLSVHEYGLGFCYYIMPANIYISFAVTSAQATATVDVFSGSTDRGIGYACALGKEWWVSDEWGLGIAGILHYSTMKDAGTYDVTNYYYGIAFSATYN